MQMANSVKNTGVSASDGRFLRGMGQCSESGSVVGGTVFKTQPILIGQIDGKV